MSHGLQDASFPAPDSKLLPPTSGPSHMLHAVRHHGAFLDPPSCWVNTHLNDFLFMFIIK